MDTISLFSGAGGLDEGFSQAGFNIKVACDSNRDSCLTFTQRHPQTIVINQDVSTLSLSQLSSADLLIGGPPCQGYSVAGKQDTKDKRNRLIIDFATALSYIEPKVFVMENVGNILSDKFGELLDDFLGRCHHNGYQVNILQLDASDFHVPQKRKRVFFVGSKQSKNIDYAFLERYKIKAPNARFFLENIKDRGEPPKSKITFAKNPVLRRSPYAGMLFNGSGRPINLDGYAPTIVASIGGAHTPIIDQVWLDDPKHKSIIEVYHAILSTGLVRVADPISPDLRRITVKEAASLQTFPSDYRFIGSVSSQYRQIGNAVPVELSTKLACAIRDYYFR